jgi:hypothetical protein
MIAPTSLVWFSPSYAIACLLGGKQINQSKKAPTLRHRFASWFNRSRSSIRDTNDLANAA